MYVYIIDVQVFCLMLSTKLAENMIQFGFAKIKNRKREGEGQL